MPSALLPEKYVHAPNQVFYKNISGFYRDTVVHPFDMVRGGEIPDYFHGVHLPHLNTSGTWNETRATELRGSFPWAKSNGWGMNVKERKVHITGFSITEGERVTDPHSPETEPEEEQRRRQQAALEAVQAEWSWVKGIATLSASDDSSVEYGIYGLHHLTSGRYNLFGLPDGMQIDIRHIPLLFPEQKNITQQIVLGELKQELDVQRATLMPKEVQPDGMSTLFLANRLR